MPGTDFHVRRAIEVAAHPDRVWEALVDATSAWWGAPYLLLDGPSTIELPLRAGDAVVEHLGETSALWGVATIVAPGRVYAWRGQMGMGAAWDGEVRIDIEPAPAGARVTVQHDAVRLWGDADVAAARRSYDHGWADLLARLARFVETGERLGAAGSSTAPEFAFEPSVEAG